MPTARRTVRKIPLEARNFADCTGELEMVWPKFLTVDGSCVYYDASDGTPADPNYDERRKDTLWYRTELGPSCDGCTVVSITAFIKDGKQEVRLSTHAPDDWHRL